MSMIMFLGLMFVFSLASFLFNRNYLLLMLLSLEFMVLILFFSMILFLSSYGHEFYLVLLFLTFSVCEGALGLSVLVSMVRVHGNDYIMNSSLMW